MNRPDKRNALNHALTQALLDALHAAEADEGVRSIVLTGAGPAFCAGADLTEFKDLTPDNQPLVENRAELTMNLHGVFSRLAKPVVTAINGAAMGGGAGLALAGDVAVMASSREARLSRGEARHRRRDRDGQPGAQCRAQGGLRAGGARASRSMPQRACALGLVNRVIAPDNLMADACALAEKLAAVSRPAMAATKQLFYRVVDLPFEQALEEGRDINQRMRAFRKARMKPLQHVTILDLSRVLACPFASMILAELGAHVIKIEEPSRGDETRSFEPFVERGGATESAYYFACNRSKQSVTVNLRAPEGQTIIRDLAREADVFLENFPVGTLKRYGLDYAAIRAVNERIVYVSCTGFGQSGPFAHRKGYDTIFQAMGGIMSLTGERGGPPVKPGLPFADLTSGLWVAIAILAGAAGTRRAAEWLPHRLLHARRADRAADARRRALFRAGRGPAAARHRASRPRSLGKLPLRRRRLSAHHRERPALAAALPRARARGLGQRAGAR